MAEKDYKKLCEEYESILGIDDKDLVREAFLAYCKMVDMQTKRLKKFNLDNEIIKEKADLVYDRTMAIAEKMPKSISEIISLREQLKITKKEIEESFADTIAQPRN